MTIFFSFAIEADQSQIGDYYYFILNEYKYSFKQTVGLPNLAIFFKTEKIFHWSLARNSVADWLPKKNPWTLISWNQNYIIDV